MDISPTPEEPEHCPTCGASVRRADHFCSVCGQNLPWTPLAGDQAQLPIEQPAHLTRYSATGEIVQDYVLDKREITIGRAEANDILLSLDSLASRHHVTIHHEQGEYLLRDEGSENGTMLNGALLPELTPQILREGDQVSMGEYTFVFSQERGAYQKQPIETVRESAPVLHLYRTLHQTHRLSNKRSLPRLTNRQNFPKSNQTRSHR